MCISMWNVSVLAANYFMGTQADFSSRSLQMAVIDASLVDHLLNQYLYSMSYSGVSYFANQACLSNTQSIHWSSPSTCQPYPWSVSSNEIIGFDLKVGVMEQGYLLAQDNRKSNKSGPANRQLEETRVLNLKQKVLWNTDLRVEGAHISECLQ